MAAEKIKFETVKPSPFIPNGGIKMTIPALRKLLDETPKKSKSLSDIDKEKYFVDYKAFLKWVVDYVNDEIGSSTSFTTDQLISIVFNDTINSFRKVTGKFDYYMYLCKVHAEKLLKQARKECVPNYINSAWLFMSDVEDMVAIHEFYRKKTTKSLPIMSMGVRPEITPLDLKFAANELMYLNECEDVSKLDFRDIQPCAIMIIRQAIELLGKNLIGYRKIKKADGSIVKNMTQVAWQFLEKENGKHSWSIELPLKLENILRVNRWANEYVHNPWINNSYVRAFGLEVLWEMMYPPKSKTVKCYNNKSTVSFSFGDFRINGYNQLKADFESYVKGRNKKATIDWLPIDKVEAYIISL